MLKEMIRWHLNHHVTSNLQKCFSFYFEKQLPATLKKKFKELLNLKRGEF